jgi:hypothetical protein
MLPDVPDNPARFRKLAVAAPWAAFATVLAALICSDLAVNPILDERLWLQEGLATADHRFLRTGLTSGPLYGLLLGALFSLVYLGGTLGGAFAGPTEFVAWFFGHQALFYFLARCVTAGIATGGLALLGRAIARWTGPGIAGLFAVGFAFTVPALDRLAFATPHASMIGFSAALLFVLHRAREGGSRFGWCVAGALVSAATAAMTIGLGLGLLAFWAALAPVPEPKGPRRGQRVGLVLVGLLAGFVLFGYPILLHPHQYWEANVKYQVARQILTDEGGRGNLLLVWAREGLALWLAGLAGLVWGRFPGGRALPIGAFVTASGFVIFLAAFTRSAQVSYSLAALPCLAYAASGLVEPLRRLKPPARVAAAAAVLIVPASLASVSVGQRLLTPHEKALAARQAVEILPAGAGLLVDTWYGPALNHPRLLLAPYGSRGEKWAHDAAFTARLESYLPPEENRWRVLAYPKDMPIPDQERLRGAGIDFVIVSSTMMEREPARGAWRRLLEDGTLEPLPPDRARGIRFFRVAPGR